MNMFDFKDQESLGKVLTVDTTSVIVNAENIECLHRMRVNRLVMLQSRPGEKLVGLIRRVTRVPMLVQPEEPEEAEEETNSTATIGADLSERNQVYISLVGTHFEKRGTESNVFTRSLETFPEIDAHCFPLEDERLTHFMQGIRSRMEDKAALDLGRYTLDNEAKAYLNGNRLIQRHVAIVGSTGAGKSWTVARIIEQAAALENTNAILFDIHGEYKPLTKGKKVCQYRIAGPGDIGEGKDIKEGILFLPFWLLDYPAIISMFVDRSDQNAPNQAMVMSREVVEAKQEWLKSNKQQDILDNFTVDSPVPFDYQKVIGKLKKLDNEMVPGSNNRMKQGDFHGKLSRMLQRLEAKIKDRRLGFMFQSGDDSLKKMEWLDSLVEALMEGTTKHPKKRGVKIIDFSEVPSDILPLVVSLVARIVFLVQQWTPAEEDRYPIALFCDEAHLYIPNKTDTDSAGAVSVDIFERIAKEGRKYGVGLVVISQRPADVNRTVLSQCNNFIAMRLTNSEDQSVIRRLFPDDMANFASDLPILDIGEALVVGDASILPTRVRVTEPQYKPSSTTIDFWDKWQEKDKHGHIGQAIDNWRKQTLTPNNKKEK